MNHNNKFSENFKSPQPVNPNQVSSKEYHKNILKCESHPTFQEGTDGRTQKYLEGGASQAQGRNQAGA
jgi:hypothetical protein